MYAHKIYKQVAETKQSLTTIECVTKMYVPTAHLRLFVFNGKNSPTYMPHAKFNL